MDNDHPAVIAAAVHTLRTLVDGTLSVTLQVEPRHATDWIRAFGTLPGTPVAVARLVPEAAQASTQRETDKDVRWGHVYEPLFRFGWFHNPKVSEEFGVADLLPDERVNRIKREIYRLFGVSSLAELNPTTFYQFCRNRGIAGTLPASVIEEATGRPT